MARVMMRALRLSLRSKRKEPSNVIICICRGKSGRDVLNAIDNGVSSVRDFQRCGIGDQCGSCHNTLRGMLARAATERAAQQAATDACPGCAARAAAAATAGSGARI
jgi:bacterioferritin-associated ferredoxin